MIILLDRDAFQRQNDVPIVVRAHAKGKRARDMAQIVQLHVTAVRRAAQPDLVKSNGPARLEQSQGFEDLPGGRGAIIVAKQAGMLDGFRIGSKRALPVGFTLQAEEPVVARQRVVVLPQRNVASRAGKPAFRQIRLEGERPIVGRQRFLISLEPGKRLALVVESREIIPVKRDGPVEVGDGALVQPQLVKAVPRLFQVSRVAGLSRSA